MMLQRIAKFILAEDIEEFKNEIRDLRDENEALREEKFKNEIRDLRDENEALREEKADLTAKNASLAFDQEEYKFLKQLYELTKKCLVCGKNLCLRQKTYCSRECRYAALKERAQAGFLAEGRHKPRKKTDSKLARLRMERGLTQAQLVEMTGLSDVTISGIESGRAKNANLSTYQRIAAALGVDWRELAE